MLRVRIFMILSWVALANFIQGQNCPFFRCQPGWKMWRRGCYSFTSALTWADAKESCLAMGGEMVAPWSREQNDFFSSYSTQENTRWTHVWIACDDLVAEGEWMCNNIHQSNTFAYWSSREPNNRGNEDCGAITEGREGKWDDKPCGNRYPAICYRKPSPY